MKKIDFERIKALSFDLDDTLWSIMPIIERAERVTTAWIIERYPDTQNVFESQELKGLRAEVFSEYPDKHYDLAFLRKEYIARILEHSGYDRQGVEAAFQVFKYERDTIELFDDVMPFFEQLNPRYKKLALTNGNASLERTPLKDSFDSFFNATQVKSSKPEPVMFELALEHHELEADEMLHIGDCLISDIGGAADVGIPTVWINRFSRKWQDEHRRPNLIVNTLDQLSGLLSSF